MPHDVCRGREAGIYHTSVCLSCLPSCLYLHYCSSWKHCCLPELRAWLPRVLHCLGKLLSTVLVKLEGNTKGEKKATIQGAVLGCYSFLQWWAMEYTLKMSVTADLRGSPTCCRITIRTAKKRKDTRGVGWLHQLNVTKAKAKSCPEGEGESRCAQTAGGSRQPTSQVWVERRVVPQERWVSLRRASRIWHSVWSVTYHLAEWRSQQEEQHFAEGGDKVEGMQSNSEVGR